MCLFAQTHLPRIYLCSQKKGLKSLSHHQGVLLCSPQAGTSSPAWSWFVDLRTGARGKKANAEESI